MKVEYGMFGALLLCWVAQIVGAALAAKRGGRRK